jgi:hypothetical protein
MIDTQKMNIEEKDRLLTDDETMLYEDEFVRLTADGLLLKTHTALFGDQFLSWTDIKSVHTESELGLRWFHHARMGMGGPGLWSRIWWQHTWPRFMYNMRGKPLGTLVLKLAKPKADRWFTMEAIALHSPAAADQVHKMILDHIKSN